MRKQIRPTVVGLALAAFSLNCFAQTRSDVDRLEEIEYWKSAAAINTAQAYQAYLSKYSSGTFAALAAAAVQKLASSGVGATSGDIHAMNFVGLTQVDEPTGSSQLDFPIGTRLLGPGTIQVGSLGSRTQIYIPAGSWIFLGSSEYSATYSISVPMVSSAFGQVSNGTIVSILMVQMTRGPVIAAASGWPGLARCQSQADSPEFTIAPSHRRAQVCSRVLDQARIDVLKGSELATWELAKRNLGRIGAKSFSPNSRIEASALGPRNNYVEYVKFECSEVNSTGGSCGVAGAFALGAGKAADQFRVTREKWLREYALYSAEGIMNDLDIQDITPQRRLPE